MELVELVLKDVPEDCVAEVKKLATIAIDRYYHKINETVDPVVIDASNAAKDDFRVANDLPKHYNLDSES